MNHQTEQKIKEAMKTIEANPTFSFHHYSIELNIPAQILQEEWAKYTNTRFKK